MKAKKNNHVPVALALVLGAGLGFFLGRASAKPKASQGAIHYATFNGGVVTESEVLAMIASEIEAQKGGVYDLKLTTASALVKRRVLELEAAKQKLTPEELIKRVSEKDAQPVTDQDVEAHLASNGVVARTATPQQRENARSILKAQRAMQNGDRLIENLMVQANVQFHIEK